MLYPPILGAVHAILYYISITDVYDSLSGGISLKKYPQFLIDNQY